MTKFYPKPKWYLHKLFKKHFKNVKFYPRADNFTHALHVMHVTNIMSDGALPDFWFWTYFKMYLYTIAEYEISHKTTYQNDSWYVPGDCKMFVPSYVKLCNTIFYSHIQLFCSRHLLAVVETPSFTEPHRDVKNRLEYVHLRDETPCLWKMISTIAQAVDHKTNIISTTN